MLVNHLVYEGNIVGVRVERSTYLFDMDMETFNSSALPQIIAQYNIKPGVTQLVDHGNIIASKGEIGSGVYATDVSGDLHHVSVLSAMTPETSVPYADFSRVRSALEKANKGKEISPSELSRKSIDICRYFHTRTGQLLIQFSREVQRAAKDRNISALSSALQGTNFSPFKEEWLYAAQQDGLFGILAVAK